MNLISANENAIKSPYKVMVKVQWSSMVRNRWAWLGVRGVWLRSNVRVWSQQALAIVAHLIGLILWATSKIQCCRWFVGSVQLPTGHHYFEQMLRL
jgi:hypothetical protein